MSTPEMIATLENTLTWLDNLVTKVGLDAALDCMPNNYTGRYAIKAAIATLEVNP